MALGKGRGLFLGRWSILVGFGISPVNLALPGSVKQFMDFTDNYIISKRFPVYGRKFE
jgi:hypothetical protein